ncbi:MAG: ABC transporter ATP-binding protein [Rhizobiales bacterium]|nr:ABC transporter ATP-binding protein [Hyphomicrobiales bacterium]
MDDSPALRVDGVTVEFGSLRAVDDVSLACRAGEVYALVGENGAGKTTLMNVIAGVVRSTRGSISVAGRPLPVGDTRAALQAGVGMVRQHHTLIPSRTVAENIVLGHEPRRGIFYDRRRAAELVAGLSSRFALPIDPNAVVADLPVGLKQRVELLKVLSWDVRIVILDEPTAVLPPDEASRLLDVMRGLAAEGRTVLFISHKLKEVVSVSDRVGVLRAGRLVAESAIVETSIPELASRMIGEDAAAAGAFLGVDEGAAARSARAGAGTPVLAVEALRVTDADGKQCVDGVDLDVAAGEITAIVGVEGNGQAEFMEAIAGIRDVASGRVSIGGTDVTGLDVEARRQGYLAHIPEDRLFNGACVSLSLRDNLILGFHREPRFRTGPFFRAEALRAFARGLVGAFDIRARYLDQPIGELSGGNIQRAIVARESTHDVPLVLVAQPTRGVDIRAMATIHARLRELAAAGRAVLLVTSDLDEALALSHRIAVFFRGRILLGGETREIGRERIGLAMSGALGT